MEKFGNKLTARSFFSASSNTHQTRDQTSYQNYNRILKPHGYKHTDHTSQSTNTHNLKNWGKKWEKIVALSRKKKQFCIEINHA